MQIVAIEQENIQKPPSSSFIQGVSIYSKSARVQQQEQEAAISWSMSINEGKPSQYENTESIFHFRV